MVDREGQGSLGLVAPLDEKSYEKLIVKEGAALGWTLNKVRRTPIKRGGRTIWITPTTVKGWPDLVAVHPAGYVLFLEVKGDKGPLKPEQKELAQLLQPGLNHTPDGRIGWYVVYPADWPKLHALLSLPGAQ